MKAQFGRHIAIVIAIAGIVMLTNLGGPRLWDRDEPRNAGCAREMLERGDWIVPTFNAELRTHKPVLLYWLIMSSYSVLGVDEFSARLPSALCAIGACVATYAIGRRLFSPRAALLASLALATSVMFVIAGRAATPDSVLIFCTTAAIATYVCGTFRLPDEAQASQVALLRTEGHYFPQDWRWVVALYAVMGLAVLAKGPVGLVLPTAVIGLFLLIVRLPEPASTPANRWLRYASLIARPVPATTCVRSSLWALPALLHCRGIWQSGRRPTANFSKDSSLSTTWSARRE
jgi:4-amino-4-deoxy-L-arabinose transferase-like glycosyltransferase